MFSFETFENGTKDFYFLLRISEVLNWHIVRETVKSPPSFYYVVSFEELHDAMELYYSSGQIAFESHYVLADISQSEPTGSRR